MDGNEDDGLPSVSSSVGSFRSSIQRLRHAICTGPGLPMVHAEKLHSMQAMLRLLHTSALAGGWVHSAMAADFARGLTALDELKNMQQQNLSHGSVQEEEDGDEEERWQSPYRQGGAQLAANRAHCSASGGVGRGWLAGGTQAGLAGTGSAVADALLAAQHALALLLVHYCQTLQHALITAQGQLGSALAAAAEAQAQLNSLQHIGLGAAQLEDTLTEMAAERSRLLQQIASQRSDIQHLFNMLALSNSAVEGVNDTVEAVLAGMQEEGQGAGAAAAAGAAAGDVEGVGGGMAGVLGGLLGVRVEGAGCSRAGSLAAVLVRLVSGGSAALGEEGAVSPGPAGAGSRGPGGWGSQGAAPLSPLSTPCPPAAEPPPEGLPLEAQLSGDLPAPGSQGAGGPPSAVSPSPPSSQALLNAGAGGGAGGAPGPAADLLAAPSWDAVALQSTTRALLQEAELQLERLLGIGQRLQPHMAVLRLEEEDSAPEERPTPPPPPPTPRPQLGLMAPSGQQAAALNDSSQTSSSSCRSSSQPPPLPPDSARPPNAPQGEAPTAYLAASNSSSSGSGSSQCRQGAVPPEDTGEQSVVGQSPAGGPQVSGALVSRGKGDPGQWGSLGAGPRTPRLTLAATAAAGAACVLAAAGASSSPAAAGLAQALLQASGGVLAAGTPRGPGSSCLQEAGREPAAAGSDPTVAGRVVGEGKEEEGEVTAKAGGHSAISAGPAAACLMRSSEETVDEGRVRVEGAVEDPVGTCAGAAAGRVPLQQQVAGSNPAPQPGQQLHHSDCIMQRLIDSDFAPGFENLLKQQQQQQLGGAVGMPVAAAAAIDPPLQQHRVRAGAPAPRSHLLPLAGLAAHQARLLAAAREGPGQGWCGAGQVVEGGGCMARGVGVGAGQRSLASAVEVSLQGLLEGYAELDQALSSVFSGTFGAVRAMLRCSFTSLALATALFLTAGQAAMGVKAGAKGQDHRPKAINSQQPSTQHAPLGSTGSASAPAQLISEQAPAL